MKKINPKIRPRDNPYWLLYSMHEGEEFSVLQFTPEEFAKLRENTFFEYRPGDYIKRIYPAAAVLVKSMDGEDFVIRRINGEYVATGQSLIFKNHI